MSTDIQLARKFSNSFRYIDDLGTHGFDNFDQYLPVIYPQTLEVKKSSNNRTKANFLDLNLQIDKDQNLEIAVYDKRDDFPFPIVNFSFLDSCIPRKPALGIYLNHDKVCKNLYKVSRFLLQN